MFATYTPALKWYETFNTNNAVDKSAYLANAHSLYTAVARAHVCNSLFS